MFSVYLARRRDRKSKLACDEEVSEGSSVDQLY